MLTIFDISSDFMVMESGCAAILFDDPNFVRSETVLFDRHNGLVEVLLQGKLHQVGQVPEELMKSFAENKDVILSAILIDGTSLELTTRLVIVN
ncbi:MAG: hypothetical protein PHX61_12665 [Alphaproteobacteria bacterium]|nr:hypothetical protein [Alphaproteobacteria bacterium]OIN86654.1 MAG: hypothetical protein AUJ12_05085 [Alphaproteobacteria bacterium CG1_02_46_17]